MSVDQASPLLAFYNLVASAPERGGTDEENGGLLGTEPFRGYDTTTAIPREEILGSDEANDGESNCYKRLLDTHPLAVKGITAFFILGFGDFCAQGVEHLQSTADEEESWDWVRAIRFGAFGLLGAPWAHYYYYFLDAYFPPTKEPFTRVTALKLLIDQGLQAPTLLAFIIALLALLKGGGLAGMRSDLQVNYWHTLIANCTSKAVIIWETRNSAEKVSYPITFSLFVIQGFSGYRLRSLTSPLSSRAIEYCTSMLCSSFGLLFCQCW